MFSNILKKCPLFENIESAEFDSLLRCLGSNRQEYKKDEFIFRVDEPAKWVGIVLSGGVNVIQEDFWGNRSILTHVEPGELFAEAFSCAEIERLPVSVIATEACEILLIDYHKIISACPASCEFHARLISNMVRLMAHKNIILMRKMEYISKRTMREKVLSFLSAQAFMAKSNEITIPFNRQEMADFLCVERSALSRVLIEMKSEGILDYEKNRFKLIDL